MSDSRKMSEPAKIDYINKIDFSKGFQRFHIKFPLKNLTRPKQDVFEITVKNGCRKYVMNWRIGIWDYINPAYNQGETITVFEAHLNSTAMIIPIMYRMRLTSSSNLIFDASAVVLTDIPFARGFVTTPSVVDEYPTGDLTLHYWMDIPTAAIYMDNSNGANGNSQSQNSIQTASKDVLLSDASIRVMNADYDPLSDVCLIIVNKEDEELRRFRCHTVFLRRSDYFKRMFESKEWKESSVKNGRSVRINDINARVMETVLQYIYTLALPDSSTNHQHLCGIIYAADIYKYNLPELKNWCVGVLIIIYPYDSIENRIQQLVLANCHNLFQLKAVCLARLSLGFSTSSLDHAISKDIPNSLWLEIMNAVFDRHMKTTDIVLSAA